MTLIWRCVKDVMFSVLYKAIGLMKEWNNPGNFLHDTWKSGIIDEVVTWLSLPLLYSIRTTYAEGSTADNIDT